MTDIQPVDPERKPFSSWAPWGIPLSRIDRRMACEELRDHFLKHYGSPQTAMEHILLKNEEIVARCSLLMSFSGILMAVLLFVAVNPKLLPAIWQRYGFYTVALIWAVCIIRLLSSLKHVMPPLWQYATGGLSPCFRSEDSAVGGAAAPRPAWRLKPPDLPLFQK